MPLWGAVLAGGQSKRFRSRITKVFHPLCGKPLLEYPLSALRALEPQRTVVVLSPSALTHLDQVFPQRNFEVVIQEKALGTGDAVKHVRTVIPDARGDLVVLPGDAPLVRPQTLIRLLQFHRTHEAVATVMTARVPDPTGYGRVIRSPENPDRLLMIVEEVDAFPEEKQVKEINAGVYVFRLPMLFEILDDLRPENRQQEYYLTDAITISQRRTGRVFAYQVEDWEESLGVNTRQDLSRAHKILRHRIVERWMGEGVTFVDPENVYIEYDVELAQDVMVYPHVSLMGTTRVGEGAILYPGVVLKDMRIPPATEVFPEDVTSLPTLQEDQTKEDQP